MSGCESPDFRASGTAAPEVETAGRQARVGVFYVAVLPQFIPAGAPHLATGVLLTSVVVVGFGLKLAVGD